ncbi:putative zinc finger CCHC domain-containing protein [Tetrabaena socialis]|uniref:Putative zinc finger CCHC domain-containing protein n=1 Tax=Tetrabaena socialis TaxID=47790 RepID=A0A2J8ACJ2_9CHLO|nr:putative zinc finger CCHC domain-containing protein [Tetrabaena socialis]|eukprot:PNH10227.1 putative zinc finger CCHC domain-containing protein [Tetrabaena socialis]
MEHIFGKPGKGKGKAPPSRGVIAGVKADMERAKEGYDPKNPNGTGAAWTHNFLNQKPWHPMSFRNRMKVWENEQDKGEADKIKEKAQAEFDAEQEYLKTLSEVQSVSFMYQKPPGLDAALARDAENEKKKAAKPPEAVPAALDAPPGSTALAAASAAAPGGKALVPGEPGAAAPEPPRDPEQERAAMVERLRQDPYAVMLAARVALHNDPRRREAGAFGGFSADAHNQQLLVEDPEAAGSSGQAGTAELDFLLQLPADQQLKALKRIAKRRKKEEEERKLREAEAVLRAAGYDLGAMAAGAKQGGKHKKSKKHKKEDGKSRKSKRRRESDSGSDSG